MKEAILKMTALIALAIVLIIVSPFVSIWSLNTLFPVLAIPYTFWTWLAMLVFNSAIVYRSKN